MSVITDLNTAWEEKGQREDAFKARAALEDCTEAIDECHQTIQGIVDAGNFDTLPTELKNTFNTWWVIIKTSRTAIGTNSEIMDVYNWRP